MSQSLPKTINLGRKVYQLLTITKNMFEKKKLKKALIISGRENVKTWDNFWIEKKIADVPNTS